ncbi:HGGxSTG domain-containing protein [Desulfolithobacter sp.]
MYSNGRCKLHGGLSTGPKTKAGLRRVTANLPGRVQSP